MIEIPSKIVCVGLNYKDHAAEQHLALPAEPMIFLKPSTAVIQAGETIRIPPGVGRVDHEAELGIVIARRAYRVPKARALEYVRGVTCVNDVTARELQAKGKTATVMTVVLRFPMTFIRQYFLRGHVLNGYPGFVWSLFSAFYPVVKYAKLREMTRQGHPGQREGSARS